MIPSEQLTIKLYVHECPGLWEGDGVVVKAEPNRTLELDALSPQVIPPWTSTVTFLGCQAPSPQTHSDSLKWLSQLINGTHTSVALASQGMKLMDLGIVTPVDLAWSVRMASLKCVLLRNPGQTSVCGFRIRFCWVLEEEWPQAEKSDCPVGHLGKKQVSKHGLILQDFAE